MHFKTTMDMHWIGIDVSKAKLDVVLTDDRGAVIEERKVANTDQGLTGLIKRWSDTYGLNKKECLICLEPTGHYSNQALRTLVKLECPTWLAHPRDIQKSIGLQRGKSDKVDARRIADYARRFGDKAHLFTSKDLELEKVGHLLTRRRQLVKERKRYMVQLKDRNPCLAELRAQFDRFDKQQVAALNKAIKQVEAAIEKELSKDAETARTYELLCSVPGVGLVLAAYLMVKTAAFTRFPTPRALACQAGVVPYEHTSGTSVKGKPRVSHHADKPLKSLLHMAAIGMVRLPCDLQAYYQRKVAEGKPKMVVLNAMRNKIIHRIYAVIGRGEPYRVDYTPVMQQAALAIL